MSPGSIALLPSVLGYHQRVPPNRNETRLTRNRITRHLHRSKGVVTHASPRSWLRYDVSSASLISAPAKGSIDSLLLSAQYSIHLFVASSTASTVAVSIPSFTWAVPVSSVVSRPTRVVSATNTNSRSNAPIRRAPSNASVLPSMPAFATAAHAARAAVSVRRRSLSTPSASPTKLSSPLRSVTRH